MYKLSRLLLILALLACFYCLAVIAVMCGPQSVFALALIALVYAGRRGYAQLSNLGSARWANLKDLRQAGMVSGNSGLMLGHLLAVQRGRRTAAISGLLGWRLSAEEACREFCAAFKRGRGPLVRLPHAIHTAVFSPSGGGKGVSFVIPFLLTCRESCVVIDFKGENAKLTAEYRRKVLGHEVVIVDPYKQVTQTPDTFDPLDFIDRDNSEALDECNDLAKSLVVRTGEEKEPHWNDSAEMWIAALIAVVVMYGNEKEGTRSLQTVRDILSNPQKLEMAIKLMLESKACDGILARMGGQLTHFIDKEKSSTLTTVSRHLRFLDSPAVSESTQTSSFDPTLLRSGKMTIYFAVPPNHGRVQSPLLRMWIASMFRVVVDGGLQERNKVHFVLDETTSLGHLDAIDDALDKYRGYGIRLQFYFQSMGQLKKCFPDGQDQTLLTNTTQIFFGVNDQGLAGGVGTADYVSARLGEQTLLVRSGGTSTGRSTQWSGGSNQQSNGRSWSHNANDNWQPQVRKLLKPEEVVALSPRIAITFTPGVPPICTALPRYYEKDWLGMTPGVFTRAFTACNTLVVAALLCAMSLGFAVRATQRALEPRGEQPTAHWHQHHRAIFRNHQPDVPVD